MECSPSPVCWARPMPLAICRKRRDAMAFSPAAERYNMMPLIDQWGIPDAFAKINSLSSKGATGGTYAINISGTSIGDERFLEFVREQFRRYVMRPGTICLELTETAAIANFD